MSVMRNVEDGVDVLVAAKLAEIQGTRTDAEFAAILGVSRAHWTHIRAGRRSPSYALIKRAAAQFPELDRIVMLDFLSERTS